MGNQSGQTFTSLSESDGPVERPVDRNPTAPIKCRVLILGTSGSGKSTIWFQITRLAGQLDEKLVVGYSNLVRYQVVQYLAAAYEVTEKNGISFQNSKVV